METILGVFDFWYATTVIATQFKAVAELLYKNNKMYYTKIYDVVAIAFSI